MKQPRLDQNINVDLNDVPSMTCKCGHKLWKAVAIVKKISALVSPTGKETIVPIQVLACDKCGRILPGYGNLNETEEIKHSEGESIDAVNPDERFVPDSNKKIIEGT